MGVIMSMGNGSHSTTILPARMFQRRAFVTADGAASASTPHIV
jgi:hypothetical protein